MKPKWYCLLVWAPLAGWSMGFSEYSERVYSASEALSAENGRAESLRYEKAAALASEPLNLEASSRKIRADDPADEGMEYGMMVGWTLKMPSLKAAQGQEWEILGKNSQRKLLLARRQLKVELKREWLLAEAASERADILAEKWEVSKQAHAIGSKKHQAGRLSQMELLRLESEAGAAKTEWEKAAMEAEHFQHRLQERAMMREKVMIDDLTFRFLSGNDQSLLLIENAPAAEALRMRIEETDAQIETLRRSTVESVGIGVGMTSEPTQKSLDMRLSIPLAAGSRNEHKIAALLSERSSLLHQKSLLLEKMKLGIEAKRTHLQERERLIGETRAAEKKYETLFTMAHKALEGGVMTQFEYLASKNAFYDARLRTIDLREQYIEELNEIEQQVGETVE